MPLWVSDTLREPGFDRVEVDDILYEVHVEGTHAGKSFRSRAASLRILKIRCGDHDRRDLPCGEGSQEPIRARPRERRARPVVAFPGDVVDKDRAFHPCGAEARDHPPGSHLDEPDRAPLDRAFGHLEFPRDGREGTRGSAAQGEDQPPIERGQGREACRRSRERIRVVPGVGGCGAQGASGILHVSFDIGRAAMPEMEEDETVRQGRELRAWKA